MNEIRNFKMEDASRTMDDDDDDDNKFADGCSSGECPSENQDTAHKGDALPSTPTVDAAATSVERRKRRRLTQTGATGPTSRRYAQSNIDYFNEYYTGNAGKTGRMNNSSTVALFTLLFLVVLVQKDKIILDIRQSRASGGERTGLIFRIITTYILLSPIQYIKNFVFEIVSLVLHGLMHPLQLPGVVRGLTCLLIEDARMLFGGLCQNVLVIGKANVTGREMRVRRVVPSIGESMPELENEETHSIPKEAEDSRGKDAALRKQPKQQRLHEHIRQEINPYDLHELPPAFLSEKDYPKGWLVHHPIHGVITREVCLSSKESGWV